MAHLLDRPHSRLAVVNFTSPDVGWGSPVLRVHAGFQDIRGNWWISLYLFSVEVALQNCDDSNFVILAHFLAPNFVKFNCIMLKKLGRRVSDLGFQFLVTDTSASETGLVE